jgi:hypothetical protein
VLFNKIYYFNMNVDVVRLEVFTAVTMKNAVFWDIKPLFVLHRNTLRLRYRVQPVNVM